MSLLQPGGESKFTSFLYFSDTSFGNNKNAFILDTTIDCIIYIYIYIYIDIDMPGYMCKKKLPKWLRNICQINKKICF